MTDAELIANMRDTIREWERDEPRDDWFLHQHDFAEAADRIEALSAENERLREVLKPFTFREDGDDEAVSIQHPSIIVRCEVTYGDIQLARAALEARHD